VGRPYHRSLHSQLRAIAVKVGPLESQRLAQPQAGREQHGPERAERVVAGAVEQRVHLSGAQHLMLAPDLCRGHALAHRRIHRDQAVVHRRAERNA
jgi:hypothetical protein